MLNLRGLEVERWRWMEMCGWTVGCGRVDVGMVGRCWWRWGIGCWRLDVGMLNWWRLQVDMWKLGLESQVLEAEGLIAGMVEAGGH
eukprot:7444781-Pyramimonas_sp.AAC.1